MGLGKPEETTELYSEMSICAEILHCPHQDFLNLPKMERKKLLHYVIAHNEKLDYERNKSDNIITSPPGSKENARTSESKSRR